MYWMAVVRAPAQKDLKCGNIFINGVVQQSPSGVEGILLAAQKLFKLHKEGTVEVRQG